MGRGILGPRLPGRRRSVHLPGRPARRASALRQHRTTACTAASTAAREEQISMQGGLVPRPQAAVWAALRRGRSRRAFERVEQGPRAIARGSSIHINNILHTQRTV